MPLNFSQTFEDYTTMRVVLNEITFLLFGFISISFARNEGRGNDIAPANNEIAEKNYDLRNKKCIYTLDSFDF